ncbi:MAG: nuclear transport factor 2 family protein, partial [Pseudomonadales bacterium]|nr:nuclear transport factor 2 family protein [Pseudomonadales bacterium]
MVKSEKQKVIELLRKSEIESVLIDYAQACDQRAWASFDRIFAEDVCVDYGGEYQLSGREAVVSMIKSLL